VSVAQAAGGRGRWAIAPVALAMIAVAYVGPSAADDTFIYMRYVDCLLRGDGVSFNPGQPSYGLTSTVWMWLMAGTSALAGNSLAVWKATSWALYFSTCLLLWRWAARRGPLGAAGTLLLAALLVAPHLLRWSGTGMENSLAALAVAGGVLLWHDVLAGRPRTVEAALLFGLFPFVRPELGLLATLILLEWALLARARRALRTWALVIAGAAGVAVVMASIMFVMTGFWLPQTGVAKALAARQASSTYGLTQTALVVASGAGLFLPAALWLFLAHQSARKLLRPMGVFLLLVWCYLAWQGHLVSTRYYVTIAFPLAVAATVAMVDVLQAHDRFSRRRLVAAGAGLQLVLSAGVLIHLFPGTRTDEGADIRRFAERVRQATPATARIALSEVGAFTFYSDRFVIDTVGLTDPGTVEWMRANGSLLRAAVLDSDQLERFLIDRRATHYVDAFAVAPLVGTRLDFVPLLDGAVRRNVESGWSGGVWRLYRVDPR
jgi:hypothetical protein